MFGTRKYMESDLRSKALTHAPVLKFFDSQKKTVLQCDASPGGLGACLLQDGHAVPYASTAVTASQLRPN